MLNRARAHIRNNVVGYIALFFALTGVAWASQTAPKNSVVTKSIKNGAVTNKKLSLNAVTGNKVADASLSSADLAPGTIPSPPSLDGLQHQLDAGCAAGEAILSVDKNGNSTCGSFVQGSSKLTLLDNALTTGTSPVTIADLGFVSFEVQCSDSGGNTGTIKLVVKVPAGGQTHLLYVDNGNGSVNPVVVNANSSSQLGQVSNGFGKVEFSLGNGGFPGAGSGDASGTVYLNASYQNSTGTCNELGFIMGS